MTYYNSTITYYNIKNTWRRPGSLVATMPVVTSASLLMIFFSPGSFLPLNGPESWGSRDHMCTRKVNFLGASSLGKECCSPPSGEDKSDVGDVDNVFLP